MGIFSAVMFVCAGFWYLRPESAAVFLGFGGNGDADFQLQAQGARVVVSGVVAGGFFALLFVAAGIFARGRIELVECDVSGGRVAVECVLLAPR